MAESRQGSPGGRSGSSWRSVGVVNAASPVYARLQTSATRLLVALRRSTTSFLRAQVTEVGVTSSEAASLAVREAFFFDDPRLLRGTRLAQLLHGFGGILEDSKGSAATYELSHAVQNIDWFISHNWSTGRWEKFMALQLHFHGSHALAAAAVMWGLAFALTAAGAVPVVEDDLGRFAVSGFAVVLPAFALYLCFVPEAVRCLGLMGPTCFLDKTCIHQTDVDLKRQGITKLGAFLRKSSGLVVVYSDVYLRKLWTVYELACFLFVKPQEPIFLVPLYLHKFALWGCLSSFALNSVLYVLRFKGCAIAGDDNVVFLIGVLRFACVALFFRVLARELRRIQTLVRQFSVQDTICFDEGDRPLVYHNIAMFMEVAGLVPEEEPEPRALEKFNALVQGHLEKALRLSIGTAGLPYHLAVAYFLNHFSYNADMELGRLSELREPGPAIAYLLWFLGHVLAVGPLGLVVFCSCMRRLHCLPGFVDAALFTAAACVTALVLHCLYARLYCNLVVEPAAHSGFYLALEAVIFCFLLALTVAVYRPLPIGSRLARCCCRLMGWRDMPSPTSCARRPLPVGTSSLDVVMRAFAASCATGLSADHQHDCEDIALPPEATAIAASPSLGAEGFGRAAAPGAGAAAEAATTCGGKPHDEDGPTSAVALDIEAWRRSGMLVTV